MDCETISGIEPVETIEVKHICGTWKVMVYGTLTESQYSSLTHGKNQATSDPWASFRTSGLAIGWIKRLASHSPDSSSKFYVLPWNGVYSIYFGN